MLCHHRLLFGSHTLSQARRQSKEKETGHNQNTFQSRLLSSLLPDAALMQLPARKALPVSLPFGNKGLATNACEDDWRDNAMRCEMKEAYSYSAERRVATHAVFSKLFAIGVDCFCFYRPAPPLSREFHWSNRVLVPLLIPGLSLRRCRCRKLKLIEICSSQDCPHRNGCLY
jgi:hypothetical protein